MKIILCAIILSFSSCKKSSPKEEVKENKADNYKITENNKRYFVTAVGGLRLREEPSTKSKAFTVIPEGAVITAEGDTNIKESVDSVQGTWIRTSWRWTEKTGDLSEKGFVHSSFLCDIEDEKCSDLQRFVDYFKDICKQYCYSRKSFEEGDAGIMWSKPAEFSLSESDGGYRLYLGTKYVPMQGHIISVKKIKDTFYILFTGINYDQILRVKEKPGSQAFYSFDPADHALPMNIFTNTLIEYGP